jgi:hypothetical protein
MLVVELFRATIDAVGRNLVGELTGVAQLRLKA